MRARPLRVGAQGYQLSAVGLRKAPHAHGNDIVGHKSLAVGLVKQASMLKCCHEGEEYIPPVLVLGQVATQLGSHGVFCDLPNHCCLNDSPRGRVGVSGK